ncbi:hypothetical protein IC575_024305 [Cucumis melo]
MLSIFTDFIGKCIEVFMDDFTVYGNDFDSCLNSLELILKRCINTNLVLNFEKFHSMASHGIVLGHLVSSKEIGLDKAKISVIQNLSYLTCLKDVKSFLDSAGFYRRFIKDFSKIALLLTNLLQKDVPFVIDNKCVHAFNTLKDKLTSSPIFQTPSWNLPFEIMCDANDYALGAVLRQRIYNKLHARYFASQTLNFAQANYFTTDKEFLSIIFALDKFLSYIIG